MHISQVSFVKSSSNHKQCPAPNLPEFAFIGRSNVGKSSLINKLCQRKGLAKTSGKPGKTRLINHYLVNDKWFLVDLPGYGYAKASKTSREEWEMFIRGYFQNRANIMCVMVLIDSRLEPQAIDVDFISWVGGLGLPMVLVYTKADKEGVNHAQKMISLMKKALAPKWEEAPQVFITSSETGYGIDTLSEFIGYCLPTFTKPIVKDMA